VKAVLARVCAVLAVCCSCGGEPTGPAPAAPAESALRAPVAAEAPEPVLAAPRTTFVAPQPWQSQGEEKVTVAPPDLAQETWRALVTQFRPLQAPTPLWQPLPATDNVELAMQPGVRFRCLVTAVEVAPDADDFNRKLSAWVLTRSLRCSGDGWHSWTESRHSVRLLQDGTRETSAAAGALLREHDDSPAAAGARQTTVVVRDDKEQRAATTGPPRILPGVKVHDD
jgi:hypothetical protein